MVERAAAPSAARSAGRSERTAWLVLIAGVIGCVVAVSGRATAAGQAAGQDWPPFVLVGGLLLIGLVADDDGLFAAVGSRLARFARRGWVLLVGATLMVGTVTAVLNLDTSVAFLTPVLVYTARSRGDPEGPLLYGTLLLSNAGSLFLPGSNLTNLIVLEHERLNGGAFLARMWPSAIAALAVTGVVIGLLERRSLRSVPGAVHPVAPRRLAVSLGAVSAAVVLVIVLRSPALAVAAVGCAAVGLRLGTRQIAVRRVGDVLGLPLLVGLFGVAVALGTLGRVWSGPATVLAHLDVWGTAGAAALAAVLVNNLPAASLLASRVPPHPLALLIGLNLGPNLFVSGSLAWVLWLRVAHTSGANPSIKRASLLGAIAVPLSLAAAVGMLVAWPHH